MKEEVFIPKKLGKVLNKRTSIEERVVVMRKQTSCFSSPKFIGVFFTRSSNGDIKRAIISEVYSDLEEELEILTSIRDCIDYLLSIGYAEVYLSTRYVGACRVSDECRGIRIERGYILFPKEN